MLTMRFPRAGCLRDGKLRSVVSNTRRTYDTSWPTPTVTDSTLAGLYWRSDARNRHSVNLRHALVLDALGMWPPKDMETGLYKDVLSGLTGQLKSMTPNPDWVDWLMGFPAGWTYES